MDHSTALPTHGKALAPPRANDLTRAAHYRAVATRAPVPDLPVSVPSLQLDEDVSTSGPISPTNSFHRELRKTQGATVVLCVRGSWDRSGNRGDRVCGRRVCFRESGETVRGPSSGNHGRPRR